MTVTAADPLSWKACVKSNPSPRARDPSVFPAVFKQTLLFFRSGEEDRFLTVFLAKPHLSQLLSFPAAAAAAAAAAASNIMISAKKTLKSSPPSFLPSFLSSSLFAPLFQKPRTSCSSLLTHVVRCCLLFLLRIMMKNADFSPSPALLSFRLFKSAATYSACRYYGRQQQPGHLLLTVLFRGGGREERSTWDLGTYPPLFTESERASERRLDRSQIVWGKRTFFP